VTYPNTPGQLCSVLNDSAKAVNICVDGQMGCSVPANPEENNAYCDAEISVGKYNLSVKGPKLPLQTCELLGGDGGAEAHLSKGEILRCWPFLSREVLKSGHFAH